MARVDLGFAEEVKEKWRLKSNYFPSKIGGKPKWLNLNALPDSNQLQCNQCQKPMIFLMQIYAPIEDNTEAFHRTIFVFCCVNESCGEFKVFRSQLKRRNDFYDFEPPNYEKDENYEEPLPSKFGVELCEICGCKAEKHCSSCKKVLYCSKEHQVISWKNGHKEICEKSKELQNTDKKSPILFHEFALEIYGSDDANATDSEDEDEDDGKSEKQKMGELNECLKRLQPRYQQENLEGYEDDSTENEVFTKFQQRIKNDPTQIIRYYVNEDKIEVGEPLWISGSNKPNLPIPNCELCGSKRNFEFQIMPQLLNYVSAKFDFGTLIIYSCEKSCSKEGYCEEFIWKQDIK